MRANKKAALMGAFRWFQFAGFAQLRLGHDEAAISWLRRGREANRNYPLMHFTLGAALALRGSMNEAQAAVQSGLALDPNFTIRRYRAGSANDNPTFLAGRERIYEGMRFGQCA